MSRLLHMVSNEAASSAGRTPRGVPLPAGSRLRFSPHRPQPRWGRGLTQPRPILRPRSHTWKTAWNHRCLQTPARTATTPPGRRPGMQIRRYW